MTFEEITKGIAIPANARRMLVEVYNAALDEAKLSVYALSNHNEPRITTDAADSITHLLDTLRAK